MNNTVLLIVDMQNDFCSSGALPVYDTESLIDPLNIYIKEAELKGFFIIYTKDWHNKTHKSFIENGGLWPEHCVANTKGAELNSKLYLPKFYSFVHKGTEDKSLGYSAFENNKLAKFLKSNNINEVIVCGIATSFCVAQTAIKSAQNGFNTTIIKNLTRDISNNHAELEKVWQLLKKHNVKLSQLK